jgi:uncharacterized YigZ family protein
MTDVTAYETLAKPSDAELEISRSRFLAHLARVGSEADAREVIDRVRAEHPRARHHCTAFVIGADARVQRSSDDGEPGGTAGAPMLEALLSAGLRDVVAVVTRYFGGVLLGAGGLTRAYRSAVAEAVAQAKRQKRELLTPVEIECAYDVAPVIEAEARRRQYIIGKSQYAEAVTLELLVRQENIDACQSLTAEASSGQARMRWSDARFVDV